MIMLIKYIFSIRVRLWLAFFISIILIGPSFIIGWAAGIHGGFETGAKVKSLEIRNALIEGMSDKFDFFITDIKDVAFRPNSGKLSVCKISFNNDGVRKVNAVINKKEINITRRLNQ